MEQQLSSSSQTRKDFNLFYTTKDTTTMTTIEFYDRLLINDDTEDWNRIDSHLFGSDFDDDLDNKIFNWEK